MRLWFVKVGLWHQDHVVSIWRIVGMSEEDAERLKITLEEHTVLESDDRLKDDDLVRWEVVSVDDEKVSIGELLDDLGKKYRSTFAMLRKRWAPKER